MLVALSGETVDDVDRAKKVLNEMGAEDISATNEPGGDDRMDEHCAALCGVKYHQLSAVRKLRSDGAISAGFL